MNRRIIAIAILVLALLLTLGLVTAGAVPVDGEGCCAPQSSPLIQSSTGTDARHVLPSLTVTPVPTIEVMIGQVVSSTLRQYVGGLSGEWPVSIGGEPYTLTTRYTDSGQPVFKATQYVGEHLAALGLDVEYHVWASTRPPNVIGELEGKSRPQEVVILSAHLDSTAWHPLLLAPGADDNASGTAAVLVAADILTHYEWNCTLRFALWTGEEQQLLGSKAYAQRAFGRGEEIAGVLNLDMLGWDGTGGPDIDLHANQSVAGSMELAQLFAGVVEAYDLNLAPQILSNGLRASDQASFWDEGYPAILGIEDYDPAYHDFNPYYHTPLDRFDKLDVPYFTEFAKAAIGTFAHMGCLLPEHPLDWHLYLPLVARSEGP